MKNKNQTEFIKSISEGSQHPLIDKLDSISISKIYFSTESKIKGGADFTITKIEIKDGVIELALTSIISIL
jgi:hypothetical protein